MSRDPSAVITPVYGTDTNTDSLNHELLYELWDAPLGNCWLAQLTSGREGGRDVVVRRVPADLCLSNDVLCAVDSARSLSHHFLVKLLGAQRVEGELRLISEALSCLSLRELTRRLTQRE